MSNPIILRGHHGLCLHFFKGKGYSDKFVEHMSKIQKQLKKNHNTPLLLVGCSDTLCAYCPYKIGDGCESGQKVVQYDQAVFELCGLQPGMQITWEEFSESVKKNILETGNLKNICGDCQWYTICSHMDCV